MRGHFQSLAFVLAGFFTVFLNTESVQAEGGAIICIERDAIDDVHRDDKDGKDWNNYLYFTDEEADHDDSDDVEYLRVPPRWVYVEWVDAATEDTIVFGKTTEEGYYLDVYEDEPTPMCAEFAPGVHIDTKVRLSQTLPWSTEFLYSVWAPSTTEWVNIGFTTGNAGSKLTVFVGNFWEQFWPTDVDGVNIYSLGTNLPLVGVDNYNVHPNRSNFTLDRVREDPYGRDNLVIDASRNPWDAGEDAEAGYASLGTQPNFEDGGGVIEIYRIANYYDYESTIEGHDSFSQDINDHFGIVEPRSKGKYSSIRVYAVRASALSSYSDVCADVALDSLEGAFSGAVSASGGVSAGALPMGFWSNSNGKLEIFSTDCEDDANGDEEGNNASNNPNCIAIGAVNYLNLPLLDLDLFPVNEPIALLIKESDDTATLTDFVFCASKVDISGFADPAYQLDLTNAAWLAKYGLNDYLLSGLVRDDVAIDHSFKLYLGYSHAVLTKNGARGETCGNGTADDDDGDGAEDCLDAECRDNAACGDERFIEVDNDGDGYCDPRVDDPWIFGTYCRDDADMGDCDDTDPAIHLYAAETAGDGIDSDCDGDLSDEGSGGCGGDTEKEFKRSVKAFLSLPLISPSLRSDLLAFALRHRSVVNAAFTTDAAAREQVVALVNQWSRFLHGAKHRPFPELLRDTGAWLAHAGTKAPELKKLGDFMMAQSRRNATVYTFIRDLKTFLSQGKKADGGIRIFGKRIGF